MKLETIDLVDDEAILEDLTGDQLERKFQKISRELVRLNNDEYRLSEEYEASLASAGESSDNLISQIIKVRNSKNLKVVLSDSISLAQDVAAPFEGVDLIAARKKFFKSASEVLRCDFILKDLNDFGLQIDRQVIDLAEYIHSLKLQIAEKKEEIAKLGRLKLQIKSILLGSEKKKIIRIGGEKRRADEGNEKKDVVFSIQDFLSQQDEVKIVFSESLLMFLTQLKKKLKTSHPRIGATEKLVIDEFEDKTKDALKGVNKIILKLLEAQRLEKFNSVKSASRADILKWSSDEPEFEFDLEFGSEAEPELELAN